MKEMSMTLKTEDVENMVKEFLKTKLGYEYSSVSVMFYSPSSTFESMTVSCTGGEKIYTDKEIAFKIAKRMNP